jgi:Tol biopolymer transport system component
MAVGLARAAEPVGLFADHSDVGTVLHPGSVVYDAAKRSYTISGSGENVWATADAFQFVWKKMEGDFTLTADISVLGQGGDPHKKAMLMARQSLDADSAYADVAMHGVGLTSLQSRDAKGADTHEIQSNISGVKRVYFRKYGDEFTMWLAGEDGIMRMAGGSMRVPLTGQFYVGLGVCAHNWDVVETAEFNNVKLEAVPHPVELAFVATLETVTIASTDRRVTYVGSYGKAIGSEVSSPSWTPDGASLVFSHEGRIKIVPVAGGEPRVIDTGSGFHPTYAHGISPDGTMLAVSGVSRDHELAMYVVPIGGGTPRRVTAQSLSYWCGWSPDGKTIVFTGERHGEYGTYTVPVAGGEEMRVAAADADGCAEYSPDGAHIYFASNRSGSMEIWRMRPDGSEPEQVTNDGAGNWYPHVSPDGRLLAFLTQQQRGSRSQFAPVTLRVMTLADRQIRVLAKLVGGPGTMPVPSWSPDSRRLAFVSYSGTMVGERSEPEVFAPAVVK